MSPRSRILPAATTCVALLIGACGGSTDPGASPSLHEDTTQLSACDQYCGKKTTVQCGEENTLATCLETCEQTRQWAAPCEAQVDSLRACITAKGSAMCQGYNGEAEVVAPPDSCNLEFTALNDCNAAH